jgi:hypothetical protein
VWGIDWIKLAQDRYKWKALVSAVKCRELLDQLQTFTIFLV